MLRPPSAYDENIGNGGHLSDIDLLNAIKHFRQLLDLMDFHAHEYTNVYRDFRRRLRKLNEVLTNRQLNSILK